MSDPIRVLEVRKAVNGWVITAFQQEGRVHNMGMPVIYATYVAEHALNARHVIEDLLSQETWEPSNDVIMPARGTL